MIFGNAAGDTGSLPGRFARKHGWLGLREGAGAGQEWLAEAGYPRRASRRSPTCTRQERERQPDRPGHPGDVEEGLGIDMQIETQEGNVVLNTLQPTTP